MPRRARRRGRPLALLGALLAGALLVPPAGTAAPPTGTAAEADYEIKADPARSGPEINDRMYGVFYEDINHAADGGLYAERIQNPSFEFDRADNAAYTPMTAWSETAADGGKGAAEVVGDGQRLNERNRHYLKLTLPAGQSTGARYGVVNSGHKTGISVKAGARHDVSVWARTDSDSRTPLTLALRDGKGALSDPLKVAVRGDRWTKYTGSLTAQRASGAGQLEVTAGGSGTVRLDEVSLFPRDTYKGRPNGLRKDLAEKIAALNPGFVRFPGGCLVNTGSHKAYDESSGWERRRSYQWKDTVGPVEQRAVNANFWGYNQSYGLGYYEYFQFAEDIGAMPLPVVPALVTGCGENKATDDPALLKRHIQDTLDLIEFANGPATSKWGKLRAQMGHPKPFKLTHLAVGNEENLPDEFFERFTAFRKAIEAKHPEITLISNSGPGSEGSTFDRLWEHNRSSKVSLVDEHYYNSPEWFLQNNQRYDSYDRAGPKVFLGEYASKDNKFRNSLAEAAYMTGLERNADVVRMASYAPLLAHTDKPQWSPDMIWFDNEKSWGSTSYETQKLFMNNVGDRVVPSTATGTPDATGPITGAVGLSTWATSAAYDDVKVTGADGGQLLADDFSGGDGQWKKAAGRGSWQVEDGAYVQSDTAAEDTLVTAGDTGWKNYDLSVKATKRAGKEGFLVAFGVKGTGNHYWWNLGGWGNTRSAVEKTSDGAKHTMVEKAGTIESGRQYDLRVQVRDREVTLYVDGEKWGSFTDDKPAEPFRPVVTRDDRTGELIVKVVNAQDKAADTKVGLGNGTSPARTARVTTLQGAADAENTATQRPVAPRQSVFDGVADTFRYTFPANSVTFLRVKTR